MRRVTLRIIGMMGGKCFERVTRTVMESPAVRTLSMDLSEGLLTLEVAEKFDLQRVKRAIELKVPPPN